MLTQGWISTITVAILNYDQIYLMRVTYSMKTLRYIHWALGVKCLKQHFQYIVTSCLHHDYFKVTCFGFLTISTQSMLCDSTKILHLTFRFYDDILRCTDCLLSLCLTDCTQIHDHSLHSSGNVPYHNYFKNNTCLDQWLLNFLFLTSLIN